MRKIAEVMPGASGAEVKVRGMLVYVPFLISPPPATRGCVQRLGCTLSEREESM